MNSIARVSRLLVAIVIVAVTVVAAESPTMQIRVFAENPEIMHSLEAAGFDVICVGHVYVDVFTDQDGLARLRQYGYQVDVIHADVVAHYASRLDLTDAMGGYKTLAEIYAYLDDMKADHLDIMTDRISIGQTFEGRDIYAVKISDNPGVDEEEPELFFNSAIHACEVVTPEVLLYFMDYLTDNYGVDQEATDIVDNREIWLVPIVNPDGYYHNEVIAPNGGGMWRKNRRDNLDGTFGVDLARNFGYKWGYNNMSSSPITSAENYRGTEPFSEPESGAIRDFVTSRNFVLQVQYHACGGWVGFPWGYDTYMPPDEILLQIVADSMAYYNGYSSSAGYFCHGNPEDWSYAAMMTESKVLPFIVEVGGCGDGFWPDPASVPELAAANLGANLVLCRLADYVFSLGPPRRPDMQEVQLGPGSEYTITWLHDDAENPAVAYELIEYKNPVKMLDSAKNTNNWFVDGIYAERSFKPVRDNYHSEEWSLSPQAKIASLQTANPIFVEDGDSLIFWTDYDLLEGYAYVHVEVATDGYSFEPIPGNISTEYNPFGLNHGYGVTGASGGWIEAKFDLSAYAGQTALIRISFYDEGVGLDVFGPPPEGASQFFIDDIYVIKTFDEETIIGSDLTGTQYSFSDKPGGDYYYCVRTLDAENQWGDFSSFARVTIAPGEVCGDANGDGEVTVADISFLIEYLHKDGPAPDPIEAGDADGDGDVDQLDCKYLGDYLRKDGPEPICP